ncbi:MAG: hypothetical protein ACLP52_06765 [Streptosporangiaceae bacterium]
MTSAAQSWFCAIRFSTSASCAAVSGLSGTAARLLPLSAGGLVLAAGLVLLHAARGQVPAPPLARCCRWPGIAAAVAANVLYGLPFGLVGALVWAWPAVAFTGSAEMAAWSAPAAPSR